MKKGLALVTLIIAIVIGVGIGFIVHQPSTKTTKISGKPSSNQATSQFKSEAGYHISDTQTDENISMTLDAFYAPATPFTSMDEVDPSTSILVAAEFTVSNKSHSNIDLSQLTPAMLIYTDDGQYIKPLGGNVRQCMQFTSFQVLPGKSVTNCAVFIVSKNALVDTFIYKDFKWFLP